MRTRGLSLVELLVVLSVMAVLAAVAMPAWTSFIAAQRASDATNALLAGLQLARAEAIRLHVDVVVCRTLEPQARQPACGSAPGRFGARDWGAGWVVFAKTGAADARNPAPQFEPGDTVLLRQPPLGRTARVVIASTRPGDAQRVVFRAGGTFGATPGTFTVDYRAPEAPVSGAARCVVLSMAGAARSMRRAPRDTCTA